MEKSSVFKDKEVLSPSYVPKKLVGRTEQIRSLAQWFRPVLDGNVDQRITVLGPRGSGKTALLLVFCRNFKAFAEKRDNDLSCLYIPCKKKRNSWQVLGDLLRSCIPAKSPKGIGKAEILRLVEKKAKESSSHHILLLDDVGKVIREEDKIDFLHYLTRVGEETRESGHLSLVVSLEKKKTLEQLDEATRSTLFHNYLKLDGYDKSQILRILRRRKNMAFEHSAVEEKAVEVIVDRASDLGDAGYALAALQKSGEVCKHLGGETVRPVHARKAIRQMDGGIRERDLDLLQNHETLILRTLAETLDSSKSSPLTGQLYRSYRKLCESKGEETRCYVSFFQYLESLKEKGLIETKPSWKGHRGRSRTVALSGADPKVLRKRLEATSEN